MVPGIEILGRGGAEFGARRPGGPSWSQSSARDAATPRNRPGDCQESPDGEHTRVMSSQDPSVALQHSDSLRRPESGAARGGFDARAEEQGPSQPFPYAREG